MIYSAFTGGECHSGVSDGLRRRQTIREVPLFALLDDDELAVLAEQVELVQFAPRQRIYRIHDPGDRAYVMISGAVQVTTIDEDHQDVIVDQPGRGEFFGFASMLDGRRTRPTRSRSKRRPA